MSRDQITKITKDGLRYKSKEGGSPFGGSSSIGTMSCYKCGIHKPRALGIYHFQPEALITCSKRPIWDDSIVVSIIGTNSSKISLTVLISIGFPFSICEKL